jgi:hypothetical protein
MPSPTGVVTQPFLRHAFGHGEPCSHSSECAQGMPGGRRKETSRYPRTTHPKQSHDNHLRYLPVRRLGQAFQQRHARFVRLTIWLACLPTSVPVSCHASPGKGMQVCTMVLGPHKPSFLLRGRPPPTRSHACRMQADAFASCSLPCLTTHLHMPRRPFLLCSHVLLPPGDPPSCTSHSLYSRP